MLKEMKLIVLIFTMFLSCNNIKGDNKNTESKKLENKVETTKNSSQEEAKSCKILSTYNLNSKKIDLKNKNLNEISCIEKYKNLEELDLRWNEIKNLEPLKNLSNLKILKVNFNKIEDITPLLNLINLEEVWLHNNKIENISGIGNLKKLKHLDLSFNPLKYGVQEITNLKNLKRLELRETPVEVIDYVYSNYRNFLHLDEIHIVERNIENEDSDFSDFRDKIKDFEMAKIINEIKLEDISQNSVPKEIKKRILDYNSKGEKDDKVERVEVFKNGEYSIYGLHYPEEYAGKSSYETIFLKNEKIVDSDTAFVVAQLESIEGNNFYLANVAASGKTNFLLADLKSGKVWRDEYRDYEYFEFVEVAKKDRSGNKYKTFSKNGFVNVRAENSNDSKIIYKLKNDVDVQEMYQNENWSYVYFYNSSEGYMMKGYIHKSQLK